MGVTNGQAVQLGRPVDIEIVPRAHALLSASSAERWIACPPSARMEEHLEDDDSEYAKDGTAAHAFAELRLRYLLKQITKAEYEAAYKATQALYETITDEWVHTDWDGITSYVEYVMTEYERLSAPGTTIIIEARVNYSKYAQEGFGTSDALIVAPGHGIVKSIDLKFGKGVLVSVKENAQARLYALGGILGLDPAVRKLIDKVEYTIVQPRLDYVGEESMSAVDLRDWAETVVKPAAELAYAGKGKLNPTDKGCRFCKASPRCRARIAQMVLIARRDFGVNSGEGQVDLRLEERLIDPEEVAKILPLIAGWKTWANAFEKYALEMVRDKGQEIEGFKLVRGRANRAYKPGVDVIQTIKDSGVLADLPDVTEADLFTVPAPLSVAQMEKVLGKKAFAPVAEIAVYVPPGTPALVPDTDDREAIDKVAEAKKAMQKDVPA